MDSNCDLKVRILVSERNERKLELLNFVKLLRDIHRINRLLNFAKLLEKGLEKSFVSGFHIIGESNLHLYSARLKGFSRVEERSCARSTSMAIRSWWKFARANDLKQGFRIFVDSIQLERKRKMFYIQLTRRVA